jgi:hypothetical protein
MGKYLLLSVFLLGQLHTQAQQKVYDWLILYYMPYDNDLSRFKAPILNQFKNLNLQGNVCITFQTDQADNRGQTRYIINSTWDSLQVNDERSASSAIFQDYINWSGQNFRAKHYAVVLLSHGGLINEYGIDEFPMQKWLGIDSLAQALQSFNKAVGISKLDLLFE